MTSQNVSNKLKGPVNQLSSDVTKTDVAKEYHNTRSIRNTTPEKSVSLPLRATFTASPMHTDVQATATLDKEHVSCQTLSGKPGSQSKYKKNQTLNVSQRNV